MTSTSPHRHAHPSPRKKPTRPEPHLCMTSQPRRRIQIIFYLLFITLTLISVRRLVALRWDLRSSYSSASSLTTPFHRKLPKNRTAHAKTRTMARVYADVNQQMPRAYWDYDSVNISWGILENYEVVRKIGNDIQWTHSKASHCLWHD